MQKDVAGYLGNLDDLILHYKFLKKGKVKFYDGKENVDLINERTNTIENIDLLPFGKTILRQVSF